MRLNGFIRVEYSKKLTINQFYFFALGFFDMEFFVNNFLGLYFVGRNNIKRTMIFEVMIIRVLYYDARSLACHNLYIDYLLHHLLKTNTFLVLLFYFNLDKRLKVFSKIANYYKLIRDFNRIKFC